MGTYIIYYNNSSQPVGHGPWGSLKAFFTGLTYQLSCIVDTYITVHNARKITVMK